MPVCKLEFVCFSPIEKEQNEEKQQNEGFQQFLQKLQIIGVQFNPAQAFAYSDTKLFHFS